MHSYLGPVFGQVENNGGTLAQPKLTQPGGEVEMNADFFTGERMSPCTSKKPSSWCSKQPEMKCKGFWLVMSSGIKAVSRNSKHKNKCIHCTHVYVIVSFNPLLLRCGCIDVFSEHKCWSFIFLVTSRERQRGRQHRWEIYLNPFVDSSNVLVWYHAAKLMLCLKHRLWNVRLLPYILRQQLFMNF